MHLTGLDWLAAVLIVLLVLAAVCRWHEDRGDRRQGVNLRGHDWEPGLHGPLHFTTCWCQRVPTRRDDGQEPTP